MVCHYLSNPNRSLEFDTRNGETSFDFTLFLFKKDVFRKEKQRIVTDMKRKRYICSQFSTDYKKDLQYGKMI